MRQDIRHFALCAITAAALTSSAFAQATLDAANPTETDCAAIFSIISEQARESQGEGSQRQLVALRLYTRHLAAAVSNGEHENRNLAAQSIAVRALALVDLLETEDGGNAIQEATAACLAR